MTMISRYRILCVDEHSDNLEFLTKWLEMSGYQVNAASSMTEALRLAKAEKFDLFIFEGRPSELGWSDEPYERIREVAPYTPMMIYSTDSCETTKTRLLGRLAQAYLKKPSEPDLITIVVGALLHVYME